MKNHRTYLVPLATGVAGLVIGCVAGIGALFSSILPNLTNWLPAWWGIYGWFFGVAIAGVIYYALRSLAPGVKVSGAKA